MKTINLLIITVVMTLISATMANAVPSYSVIGGGDCKQVLKFCARSDSDCATVALWSAGFISGFNWTYMTENLGEIVEMQKSKSTLDLAIPFETIQNELIKQCKLETSQDQAKATIQIILDFLGNN